MIIQAIVDLEKLSVLLGERPDVVDDPNAVTLPPPRANEGMGIEFREAARLIVSRQRFADSNKHVFLRVFNHRVGFQEMSSFTIRGKSLTRESRVHLSLYRLGL